MPIKRDKQTKVIRDVPQRTLDRWPDDYEDVPKSAQQADKPAAKRSPKRAAAKRAPARRQTTEQTSTSAPTPPAEGNDTKEAGAA